jgi:hypothetical protein
VFEIRLHKHSVHRFGGHAAQTGKGIGTQDRTAAELCSLVRLRRRGTIDLDSIRHKSRLQPLEGLARAAANVEHSPWPT